MKYSQFNTVLPYREKFALYNSFQQKVIVLEPELKDLLDAAKYEGIDNLEQIHPDFYNYLIDQKFVIDGNLNEVLELKKLSEKIDNNPNMFYLTVNPTMNCNFKCWYCYETHIKDSKLDRGILSSINKFVSNTVQKTEIKLFTLSFFGGEPLLYFKKDVIPIIDHCVKECEANGTFLQISFTTNGFLINDEFINYFKKNNLYPSLQITFDGYGEEHDKVRFVNKSRGSYNQIVSNIKKLLKHENFFVRARINYTNDNITDCFKIVDDFEELSNDVKKNRILFDFHRVWQNDKLDDISITLNENAKKMQEKGFQTSVNYSPNNVLESCYADKRNSATINYNGDLFKCTARYFLPENRAGYLTEEGKLFWSENYLEKRMSSKFKNKPCLSCKIMPLCNGGCSQHAMEHIEKGEEYCVYHGDESEKDKVILTKIEEILNV